MSLKGQVTPIAILMTFITVVIYVALLPFINEMVVGVCADVPQTVCFVVQMIPWMIGLGIIGSVFVYAQTRVG